MTEPDPAKPPPLTCTNVFASTAGSLAIVASNLSSELHKLCWSYDLLSGEFTRTQNLLEAVMAAHCLGSINEAWRVERQPKQYLNKCVNLNIDLLQRLDNQNLVIASLRNKNDAYKCKKWSYLRLGSQCLIASSFTFLPDWQLILYFHEYITVYECKASNAENVTNKDESIRWGRKRN